MRPQLRSAAAGALERHTYLLFTLGMSRVCVCAAVNIFQPRVHKLGSSSVVDLVVARRWARAPVGHRLKAEVLTPLKPSRVAGNHESETPHEPIDATAAVSAGLACVLSFVQIRSMRGHALFELASPSAELIEDWPTGRARRD